MRTLSLLRHAKSSWDDPVTRDFDRPLNARGRKAALAMGRFLAAEAPGFDHVLASPAVRVVETLALVEEAMGTQLGARLDRRIYMASAVALLELVQTCEDAPHLLLIGHNPGLEDLALMLSPADGAPLRLELEAKFPTAAFATLSFPVNSLTDIREGQGHIEWFVRPRDLDPELGPES